MGNEISTFLSEANSINQLFDCIIKIIARFLVGEKLQFRS